MQDDLPHDREDRRLQDDGAHHRARAAPARSSSRARSTRARAAKTSRSSPSTAARSPRTCSRASSSATRRAPSPAPTRIARGLFEEADGGTLFLDEIGELPLALQVKLLRVLQEETIRRARRHRRTCKVDVRIIAATHRDLAAEAKAGRFREDLFYRLNVLPIAHPAAARAARGHPAARRPLPRAQQRAPRHAASAGSTPRRASCCSSTRWPGNVRELENAIERAMVLADGDVIDVARSARAHPRGARSRCRCSSRAASSRSRRPRAAIEEILIRRALQKTGGNRTRAARAARDQPPRAALQDQGLQHHRAVGRRRRAATLQVDAANSSRETGKQPAARRSAPPRPLRGAPRRAARRLRDGPEHRARRDRATAAATARARRRSTTRGASSTSTAATRPPRAGSRSIPRPSRSARSSPASRRSRGRSTLRASSTAQRRSRSRSPVRGSLRRPRRRSSYPPTHRRSRSRWSSPREPPALRSVRPRSRGRAAARSRSLSARTPSRAAASPSLRQSWIWARWHVARCRRQD